MIVDLLSFIYCPLSLQIYRVNFIALMASIIRYDFDNNLDELGNQMLILWLI